MIFGKWTPWGAFGGAMLFGFARALGSRLQFLDVEIGGFGIPSEFFQSVPFIVIKRIMSTCTGEGYENVSLAVLQKAPQVAAL